MGVFPFLVIKSGKSDMKLEAQAICGVIEEEFVKKSERIEIIIVAFGRQQNMEVIDEVLRLLQENDAYPIETRHIDLTQNWDRWLQKSAIIFLDSPEAFFTINATMELGNRLPKTFKFLLHNENWLTN